MFIGSNSLNWAYFNYIFSLLWFGYKLFQIVMPYNVFLQDFKKNSLWQTISACDMHICSVSVLGSSAGKLALSLFEAGSVNQMFRYSTVAQSCD